MKTLAGKRTFVALFMAASLMCSGSWAYAMENETEMTGGFVPVVLDDGDDPGDASTPSDQPTQPNDSSQPATQDGDSGNDGEKSQGDIIVDESSGEPSSMETELSQDGAPDNGEKDSDSSQTPSSSQGSNSSQAADSATPGIKLTNGSVVSVDDNEHLVLVAPSGDTSVLDDSQTYVMETSSDGNVTIRNEAGNDVKVKGTTVSFTDAKGKQVTVDAKKDTAKKKDSSKNDTSKSDAKDADSAEATEASEQSSDTTNGTLIAVIVAAIVAAVGVVFWKRTKK